jgi:hypothetical protein
MHRRRLGQLRQLYDLSVTVINSGAFDEEHTSSSFSSSASRNGICSSVARGSELTADERSNNADVQCATVVEFAQVSRLE